MAKAKAIPEGYHSLTPYLTINGANEAIEFYKKAFKATEVMRMSGPGGRCMHAELKIGNSHLMLSDEFPEMGVRSPKTIGGSGSSVHLYVEDVDAVFNQAVAAGAQSQMPPTDMFWGDRFSKLSDPYGHVWSIATHKEDVAPEEMAKRTKAAMAEMAQPQKTASS
jgi:PhnB protein